MTAPERPRCVAGLHSVRALIDKRASDIDCLLLLAGRNDGRLQGLRDKADAAGIRIRVCERQTLDERVPGVRHQGVIAELKRGAGASAIDLDSLLAEASDRQRPLLLLVLDGVTDPHNLGACLRSGDAAGVDAVIVPADNSAGLTPAVRKVASGAAETVPLLTVSNLRRAIDAMRAAGVWVYGAAEEGENSLFELTLRDSVALVMGAEGRGLRRLTRAGCDALYRIPMAGDVASLNVSVAAGVSLFEVVRQRLASGS